MTTIWKQTATPEQLNQLCQANAVGHLGIQFTQIGEDWLEAELTVKRKTMQPFGVITRLAFLPRFDRNGMQSRLAFSVRAASDRCWNGIKHQPFKIG